MKILKFISWFSKVNIFDQLIYIGNSHVQVPPGNVLKSYVKACAFGGQALGIVSKGKRKIEQIIIFYN